MRKSVLITGAARGIGRAMALKMAGNGYDVIINYLHSEKEAFELLEKINNEYKVKCSVIKADISKEEEVERMFEEIEKQFGHADILINNAAIDEPDLFSNKTAEQFRRILDVNVVGAYSCARRAAIKMKENGYGRIINIASTNGINTYYPMCFDYDASKAALISLTHDLAVQYAPEIHVNAIAPGFIGTEKELEGYDEEFLKQETEKILVKRYGKPEEVAELAAFLVSERADYINNTVIRIDGGQYGSV